MWYIMPGKVKPPSRGKQQPHIVLCFYIEQLSLMHIFSIMIYLRMFTQDSLFISNETLPMRRVPPSLPPTKGEPMELALNSNFNHRRD